MATEEHPGSGTSGQADWTLEEVQLAARNHGMPLEALRYDVTPIGLHYLLTHFDIPHLEAEAWRLRIRGAVRNPAVLRLTDLRARPAVTRQVTMECAGNGRARLLPRVKSQPWLHEAVGTGEWTGTPVAELLDEAGVLDGAVEAVFTGADRGVQDGIEHAYARSVELDQLRQTGALLAWALNGEPLPPQHGAPVRLVVPGWYGMTSVKWLTDVELVDAPFDGYQQSQAYRLRQTPEEEGAPLTRLAVRALMIPPGVPDFFTRRRIVERGRHEVRGRAWSGHGPIETVELSDDAGSTWQSAVLQRPADPAAWTKWRATWDAPPAEERELWCRATDAAGNIQPEEPVWNVGGYAVNAFHRVPVTVR